jgi:hypothetical protein
MNKNKALFCFSIILVIVTKCAAAVDLNLIHPDEHFQSLEPAFHALTGQGFLSWEWQVGYRPWTVPGFYLPILWLYGKFASLSGPWPIVLCRLASATLSVVCLLYLLSIVKKEFSDRAYEWLFLALGLCSGFVLSISVSTHSENIATSLYWIGFALVYKQSQHEKYLAATAGLLLGLSVALRFQMLALVLPTLFIFTGTQWYKTKSGAWYAYSILFGFVAAVALLGAIDLVTYGRPFHSWLQHYQYNFVQKVSDLYGVSPWYEYFWLLKKADGWWAASTLVALIMAALLVVTLSVRGKSRLNGKADLMLLVVPSALYAVAHFFIGHKELRFLYPTWPALIAVPLVILRGIMVWLIPSHSNILFDSVKNWSSVIPLLLCALLGFWMSRQPGLISSFDLSALSQAAYKDGALTQKHPVESVTGKVNDCIVLVEHYWAWTRGHLFWGRKIDMIETDLKGFSNNRTHCPYIFVAAHAAKEFRSSVNKYGLKHIYTDRWRNTLYGRK